MKTLKTKTQFTINVATQVKETLENMSNDDYVKLDDDLELYTHSYDDDDNVQSIYFCKHNLVCIRKNGTQIFRFGAINFADKKDKERIIEAFISLMHVYGHGTKLENSIIFN